MKHVTTFFLLISSSACTPFKAPVRPGDALEPLRFEDAPAFARDKVRLSGACLTGTPVQIFVDGTPAAVPAACETGRFQTDVLLSGPDGSKLIRIYQADKAGRKLETTYTVVKDTQAPGVAIMTVEKQNEYVVINGKCEVGADFLFAGDIVSASTAICTYGVFQVAVRLSPGDGMKNLEATQADKAGNRATATYKVLVDTVAPAVTVTAPENGAELKDSVTVTGTCESGLNVNAAGKGLNAPVSQACAANGTFSILVKLSSGDGSKEILVSQTDSAANKTEKKVTVIKDATNPVVTIHQPASGSTVATTAVISGSCETGLTVVISGSIAAQNASVMCTNGSYSFNLTVSAGDGTKILNVAQTDRVGNTGTASRSLNKDTTAPVLVVANPAAGSFVRTAVAASGTCETGLPVQVSGAGVAQASQLACSGGAFQGTLNLSSGDGSKLITFAQTDAVGNKTETTRAVTKDTVAPGLTVTQPADGLEVTANSVRVTGACESGLKVTVDGAGASSSQTLNCTASAFSGDIVLSAGNGAKTLEFSQTDNAGNSTEVRRTVTKNVVLNNLVITAPASQSVSKGAITLSGTCSGSLDVNVSGDVNAPFTIACNNGFFSTPVTLSNGDGKKTVQVAQTSGTQALDTRTFIKDTTPPELAITQPAAGAVLSGQLTLVGTCESGLNVGISGTGVASPSETPCTNGTFSHSVTLSNGDGSKTIAVQQTDAAGNTGSASRSFVQDSAGPNLTISQPAANTVAINGLTLLGACEDGDPVGISGSGVNAPSAVPCESSVYTAAILFSPGEGTKTVTVQQKDQTGNSTTITRNFIRDSIAPALSITQPAAGASAPLGISISGACETGLPVQISGSGVKAPASAVCNNSSFSITLEFSSGEGAKIITLTQADAAGNSTTVSREFNRDSIAPTLTIAAPVNGSATNKDTVAVSGTCETGFNVTVDGSGTVSAATAPCNAGLFTAQVGLIAGDGLKDITASQTDRAQNKGSAMITVTLDTLAPAIAILQPAAGTKGETGLTLSGSCETGLAVVASGPGLAATVQVPCEAQAFTMPIEFSAEDGTKMIAVSQTDTAGNTASDLRNFERGVDTRPEPIVTKTTPHGCEQDYAPAEAVEDTLDRAGPLTVSSAADEENLSRLYELLNEGGTATSDELNRLAGRHAEALRSGSSETEAWRNVLISLCMGLGTTN